MEQRQETQETLGQQASQELQQDQRPQGGKRLSSNSQRRRERRNSFFVPIVLAVIVLILLVMLFLLRREEGPQEPEPSDSSIAVPEWVTRQYLPENPFSRPGTALEEVNGVAIHYVGNPNTSAKQNRDFFASLADQTPAEEGEPDPNTYASSHFVIGMDGEIIQCIPLDEWSYCTSARNKDTISIECCHPDETGEFTPATYESLLRLVRWLQEEFDLDGGQILRHYDVTGKECPRYYVQNPEAWEQFLADLAGG
ncbi:peptidoglycan recognition family protein [Pseudoflavonifractor sp. 524-17]|uniref:peptidoglycan recognition protein family protein n=1 Tax=Pseudoflavonifractor sp. 524-17 TaxID=2304577 RepID=UPI001FAD5F8B|nr:peptidoglycan recognition family protein [Pseudoflavonifractor sp. 524-17]